MSVIGPGLYAVALCACLGLASCSTTSEFPATAVVDEVIDGDTVVLSSGEHVRYLMVDTPEITGGKNECFGLEARQFNSDLVLGKQITLSYDVESMDRFGRLLAYVSVSGVEVNTRLIERGYGCVLYIPPNGEDRRTDFLNLEAIARAEPPRGMWASCEEFPCTR